MNLVKFLKETLLKMIWQINFLEAVKMRVIKEKIDFLHF